MNFSQDIFYINFNGDLKKTDLDGFREDFGKIGNPFCAIFDFTNAKNIPVDLVIDQLKYIREYEAMVKGRLIASAILVQGWMKTMLDAVFKFTKPASPCVASCDGMECREFVQDYLDLWRIQSRKSKK